MALASVKLIHTLISILFVLLIVKRESIISGKFNVMPLVIITDITCWGTECCEQNWRLTKEFIKLFSVFSMVNKILVKPAFLVFWGDNPGFRKKTPNLPRLLTLIFPNLPGFWPKLTEDLFYTLFVKTFETWHGFLIQKC